MTKHRIPRQASLAFALLLGLLIAACVGDNGVTNPPAAPPAGTLQASITPGTCISFTDLYNAVANLFVNGSPDQNSALGKLNNLKHQLDIADYQTAKSQAFNLADFVLKKYRQGSVVASEADVVSTLNYLFCYAGLAITLSNATNAWIIYPTDLAQTLITGDGWAGTALPGSIVDEPTVIAINRLTDIFGPGGGPLATALDQYPLFYQFDKESEHNHPFLGQVVVGVCAANGIPSDVLARLRLGHGISTTTAEITPPADASFLNCSNAPELASLETQVLPGWLRGIGKLFVPQAANAFRGGGGIGGAAGSFSPFAPLDPQLSASGGAGGSAGAFLRTHVTASLSSCPPVQAPAGGAVDPACRPEVTLTTNLGTVLKDVPVDFTVETGNGTVAPEVGGVCGTFSSSATVTTGTDGKARVCWTLGSAGANSVRARPRVGGDALDATYFVPPSIVFDATANPPVQLAFGQQPSNTAAGGAIAPAPTVIIQDLNGEQVPLATNQVTITLSSASFTGSSTTQVSAVAGKATFSNLVITKAGTYTLTASATLTNGLTNTVSQSFTVSAAAPALIQTYMPPGSGATAAQSFDYGSALPPYTPVSPAPQARVTDQYGNPVGAGVSVYWSPATSNGSTLDLGTGGQTTASGTAQVNSWTLGEGFNQLLASLYSDPLLEPAGFLPAEFTASTPTGVVVFACDVGSSKTDLGPITIPAPNSLVKSITLPLSVTGQASSVSGYQAALTVRLDSYTGTLLGSGSGIVALPGNNGSPTPVTFHLAGAGVPRQTGNHTLWFQLSFSNLPATRKIQVWYNSSFANNSPCKNTRVYSPSYPSTTTYKAGVSISVTN